MSIMIQIQDSDDERTLRQQGGSPYCKHRFWCQPKESNEILVQCIKVCNEGDIGINEYIMDTSYKAYHRTSNLICPIIGWL